MRRFALTALPVLGLALAACTPPDQVDDDGDGVTEADGDCNDFNRDVFHGAPESCNGLDDDCDGEVDEEAEGAGTWYQDADADGFGDPATALTACVRPEGHVDNDGDCDDSSGAFNPLAPETDCTDPNDYNCDGSVGYADVDGDGFAACEECDDGVATTNPDADETCNEVDDDCDRLVDEEAVDASTWYQDADGDGAGGARFVQQACRQPDGFVASSDDCDDLDPTSFPGGEEVCDQADNDCDGTVDEEVQTTFFADLDADGFGDDAATTLACTLPAGHAPKGGDCDDAQSQANPSRLELCATAFDDDCDGDLNEDSAVDARTWYADDDSDGWGDDGTPAAACTQPAGYVARSGDCGDSSDEVSPAADELCATPFDDDCDGRTNEPSALDADLWYADADADLFGDRRSSQRACTAPANHIADATDCDDANADANPGEDELCSTTFDDDCDGLVNDPTAVDADTYFRDVDADTYGDPAVTTDACSAPTGFVADDTDCDDRSSRINPAATEACNGDDDDCDGDTDEAGATGERTFYADDDGDTFGNAADDQDACTAPSGYVANDDDCDDDDRSINPLATEVCDDADNDCDGDVDVGAIDASTFYADVDEDGFGDPDDTEDACDAPSGYVADDEDCDDDDDEINPDADDECDGVDNDCSGTADDDPAFTGTDKTCPGTTCDTILDDYSSAADGTYWIDPDGGAITNAFEAYCDMTDDGGGWTKIASAKWSFFFSSSNYQSFNAGTPLASNYSVVGKLDDFADGSGCFTLRFEVGNDRSKDWQDDGNRAHYTAWKQCHNPFTQSTNGSGYTYIAGAQSTTCGGFNGLHHRYQGYSFTSDPDTTDSTSCWWMQVVPNRNYNSSGYLEGYNGTNYHFWQSLWVR